jgi:hypothetical protein
MPLPNFNPGATNNPLLKLLAGRNIWGNSGIAFNEGFSPGTAEDGSSLAQFSGNTDRSKYMAFNPNAGMGGGDEGLSGAWQMKPEYQAKFIRNGQNWTQLNNTGVGGDLQVIDPSKVEWDDEFGLMTPANNIKPDKGAEYGDLALYTIGSMLMGGVTAASAASTTASTTSTLGSTGSTLVDRGINALTSPQGLYRLGATALRNTGTDPPPKGKSGMPDATTNPLMTNPGGTPAPSLGANSLFRLGTGEDDGSDGGGFLNSLLGLLGLGHNAFGDGLGTANGAIDAGNRAAALADPWGASGRRGEFNKILSPEYVMQLLSQDPKAVLNNPAYQFDLQQGTNAINMGDAAQGTLRSGNRGYELQAFGQGLASKYGQQMFDNNLKSLGMLGGLAGVNSSSPTAASKGITDAWDNASNIRNASLNGLFSGGKSNGLNGLLGLLSKGGSSILKWLSSSEGQNSGLGDIFQHAADEAGLSVDEYVNKYFDDPSNLPGVDTDINIGDWWDNLDLGNIDWGGM